MPQGSPRDCLEKTLLDIGISGQAKDKGVRKYLQPSSFESPQGAVAVLARLVCSRLNALSPDPLDPAELIPLPAREDTSCSLRKVLSTLAETSYTHC